MGVTADHLRDPNYAFIRAAPTQLKIAELARARLQQRANDRAMRNLRDHRKPVPGVVRPGVSVLPGERAVADVATLTDRLSASSGRKALDAAVDLLKAQRAARR